MTTEMSVCLANSADTTGAVLAVGLAYWIGAAGILATLVVLVLALGATRWFTTRQRDKGYEAYCAAHGYQYTPFRPAPEEADAELIASFGDGITQDWRCEISGTLNGHQFVAFEFVLRFGSGRYQRSVGRAIIKWEIAFAGMPTFFILPAETFYRDATEQPPPRVEFGDDALFTESYAVLAKDPDSVRAFLTPQVRERLKPPLVADPNQYMYSSGKTLYWWELGYLPPPADMDRFLSAHDEVRAALTQ